jgi:signal transduction histidine kinase
MSRHPKFHRPNVLDDDVVDTDAQRHRYRSPIAAIVGLSESALLRDDLDPRLVKTLRAIRALAQNALDADDARRTAAEPRGEPRRDRA